MKDWPARFIKARQDRFDAALAALNTKAAAPVKSRPALPLAQYAGRYVDAWIGAIQIGSDAKGLTINFTNTPKMGASTTRASNPRTFPLCSAPKARSNGSR